MTNDSTDADVDADGIGKSGDPHPSLRGVLVRYEDGTEEFTVVSPEVDGDELLTTWVSADESSYVDLADWQ